MMRYGIRISAPKATLDREIDVIKSLQRET